MCRAAVLTRRDDDNERGRSDRTTDVNSLPLSCAPRDPRRDERLARGGFAGRPLKPLTIEDTADIADWQGSCGFPLEADGSVAK